MKKLLITSVFFIGYLAIIFGAVACLAGRQYPERGITAKHGVGRGLGYVARGTPCAWRKLDCDARRPDYP